jgi:hypothetical protein
MERWIKKYIESLKIVISRIPEKRRPKYIGLFDFNEPLQVHVAGFDKPSFGYIIITHFPGAEPLIKAFGPFRSKDAEKVLLDFSQLQIWTTPVEDSSNPVKNYFKKRLESFLIANQPSSSNMDSILRSPDSGFGQGIGLGRNGSFLTYYGDILSMDIETYNNGLIKPFLRRPRKVICITPVQNYKRCCFSAFYPSMEIGKLEYTFSERFRQAQTGGFFGKKIPYHQFESHGKRVWISQTGQIIVETDIVPYACKIINDILCAGMLKQLGLIKARIIDIGEGEFCPETGEFKSSSYVLCSLRNLEADPRPISRYNIRTHSPRRIEINELHELMDFAKQLEGKYENLQQRLFEAYTHLNNEEYDSAFLISYIIIEYWMNVLWQQHLNLIKEERRNKLSDPRYWSEDRTIEILNVFRPDILGDGAYDTLMSLKKIRNALIHEGKKVEQKDATTCIDLAYRLLFSLMGMSIPMKITAKQCWMDEI